MRAPPARPVPIRYIGTPEGAETRDTSGAKGGGIGWPRERYASPLLTVGIQLGYVSKQLSHADVAITARHYARWVGDEIYREPVRLEPGDVPADAFARMKSHQTPSSSPTTRLTDAEIDLSKWLETKGDRWSGRTDSNRRPSEPHSYVPC